jgi:hypothetical protein
MIPGRNSAAMQRTRVFAAAIVFVAVALAAALSAAPHFHEWLHHAGGQASHECAATLLSSGSVSHSDCEPVRTCPEPAPESRSFRAQPFARVLAALEFTRLEHAPPFFS